MFNHVLVPLDGSRLAEAALPAALYVAQNMGAAVTLIHIIEKNAPEAVHGETHLTNPIDAQTYLERIARETFPPEVKVSTHVHTEEVSNIPRSIAAHADEYSPDLIILCSHGSGGLRDLLFGSIAQQIIALGVTPVLLIHPDEANIHAPFACHNLLVPVDGESDHEHGLALASELANDCSLKINLLAVIPTLGSLPGERAATGRLLPAAMRAMLDIAEENMTDYLHGWIERLRERGVQVSAKIARGDPAPVIIAEAQAQAPDVIVLGTHGKTGQGAFWAGSVAPKVAVSVRIPLLLVPVRGS